MRSRRPNGALVASREAAKYVSQGQKQPDGGSHDHVKPQQLASLEDLFGGRSDVAVGGEGEAGEGEKVSGGERWEDKV